jgi:hypothetical protein
LSKRTRNYSVISVTDATKRQQTLGLICNDARRRVITQSGFIKKLIRVNRVLSTLRESIERKAFFAQQIHFVFPGNPVSRICESRLLWGKLILILSARAHGNKEGSRRLGCTDCLKRAGTAKRRLNRLAGCSNFQLT